jgi:hypothetical protein
LKHTTNAWDIAGTMAGHNDMAAAQMLPEGQDLDALAYMLESTASHQMSGMGGGSGSGMSMGFTEGHVPMDGLPVSMMQEMNDQHITMP